MSTVTPLSVTVVYAKSTLGMCTWVQASPEIRTMFCQYTWNTKIGHAIALNHCIAQGAEWKVDKKFYILKHMQGINVFI